MPIIKKHFSLAPLNDNPVNISNASTPIISGGLSHKDGFPTIKFSIPPQPAMLEIATLKLVGQFLVKTSANEIWTPANVDGSATSVLSKGSGGGTIDNDNGASIARETVLNLPNWGGVKNVIDKVVIQSKKSLIELSSSINYGQFVAMGECYSHNEVDYLHSPLTRSMSAGSNADKLNRRNLMNAKSQLSSADRGDGGMPSLSTSNDRMVGQFFSIPIQVDLLQVQDLFLDDDYLGGLLITIHLAPDSAIFNNRFRVFDTTAQPNADQSSVSYSLKNLRLEGRYIIPTPEEEQAFPPQIQLPSRLNLINDVHSSVNANSYTPQLQMVKSVVNVFMDNNQTNNFNHNQNNFRPVPALKKVQVAKNGLRFPLNYAVEVKPNATDTIVENGTGSWSPVDLESIKFAYNDVEIRKNFERALLGGVEPNHSSATMKVQNESLVEDYDTNNATTDGHKNNCKADCVGIGTDYTLGIGLQQNFVNQDYNLTMESGVNTANVLGGTERTGVNGVNPLLQQTFIRHMGVFDTRNLVKII